MKQLQNNFTTPEQSKRLLELGVPADSADCYYVHPFGNLIYNKTPMINYDLQPYKEERQLYGKTTDGHGKYSITSPCWSVGRLNEIFKICSDNHIEIYDLDFEGTQIERAMKAFENYAKYNRLDFSKLGE